MRGELERHRACWVSDHALDLGAGLRDGDAEGARGVGVRWRDGAHGGRAEWPVVGWNGEGDHGSGRRRWWVCVRDVNLRVRRNRRKRARRVAVTGAVVRFVVCTGWRL